MTTAITTQDQVIIAQRNSANGNVRYEIMMFEGENCVYSNTNANDETFSAVSAAMEAADPIVWKRSVSYTENGYGTRWHNIAEWRYNRR